MNDNREKAFSYFLFLGILSALVFLLARANKIDYVENKLAWPFLVIEERLFQKKASALRCDPFEAQKIANLEEQLRKMTVDQAKMSSCLLENDRMKKLLGSPLPSDWKFISANAVSLGDTLRINKGEDDGVKDGAYVLSENLFVGWVTKVSKDYSLVLLPTSPGFRMVVIVKKPGQSEILARGLLKSEGNGQIVLDRVLQEESIEQGDLVIGQEGGGDLVVGRIEEVLPKTANIYQRARVLPTVDYEKLDIIFVRRI